MAIDGFVLGALVYIDLWRRIEEDSDDMFVSISAECMKKCFVIITSFLTFSAFAESGDMPANAEAQLTPEQFLLKNYGWTFDTSKWNLVCNSASAFPAAEVKKNGKSPETDVACYQREKLFWLGVGWHVPGRTTDEAEEVTYWGISKPLRWEAAWDSHLYPSVITPSGILKDSVLTIKDVGTFWSKRTVLTPVSFYHFTLPMQNGRFFIDDDGRKEGYLAFTIILQGDLTQAGAKLDEQWSKNKIREIVDSIRMAQQ